VKKELKITVNGDPYHLLVETHRTLLQVLRDDIGLTGTRNGCDLGECGACTVLLNGNPVNACLLLAHEADGQEVLTIEGLAQGKNLHPIQKAFIDQGAIQCGFCTPAMLLAAKNLLDQNPRPTLEEVKMAISGVLCRCTGYQKIIRAIQTASQSPQK
jgi:carbon-monoxide dehydrogenase small subunit